MTIFQVGTTLFRIRRCNNLNVFGALFRGQNNCPRFHLSPTTTGSYHRQVNLIVTTYTNKTSPEGSSSRVVDLLPPNLDQDLPRADASKHKRTSSKITRTSPHITEPVRYCRILSLNAFRERLHAMNPPIIRVVGYTRNRACFV
jgi:hypothetical protein